MMFELNLKVWVGASTENRIWERCSRQEKKKKCGQRHGHVNSHMVWTLNHLVLLPKVGVGLCVVGTRTRSSERTHWCYTKLLGLFTEGTRDSMKSFKQGSDFPLAKSLWWTVWRKCKNRHETKGLFPPLCKEKGKNGKVQERVPRALISTSTEC